MLKKGIIQMLLIGLLLVGASAVHAAENSSITPTQLPIPDGVSYAYATMMNDNGQILGSYPKPGSYYEYNYLLWDHGKITHQFDLRAELGTNTYFSLVGMNNHGQIIGNMGQNNAWLWENGTYTKLGLPHSNDTSMSVRFINDQGMIAGEARNANNTPYCWVWQDGTFTDIDLPIENAVTCNVKGINKNGDVVGSSYVNSYNTAGWIWQDGKATLLSASGAVQTMADYVNDQGQVGGQAYISGTWKAWLWDQGAIKISPTLAGVPTSGVYGFYWPYGLNNQGELLVKAVNAQKAWLFDGETITEVPSQATAMNENGDILGSSSGKTWVWSNGSYKYLEGLGANNPSASSINNKVVIGSDQGKPVVWSIGPGGEDYAGGSQDVTAPITTASELPSGWVNHDVTIALSAADEDGGSGVAATSYTVDGGAAQTGTSITLTTDGVHTLTYWSVDSAGNVEEAHNVTVQIDKTAPVTTANEVPSGWVNHEVTVNLAASDNGSGVAATSYTVDGGAAQTGTSITLATDGVHTLTYWSVDTAGNIENQQLVNVKIDKSGPQIIILGNTSAYTVDQSINIICSVEDTLSGVASSDCNDITGAAYSFILGENSYTFTATDNVGNVSSSTISFTVSVNSESLGALIEQIVTDEEMVATLTDKLATIQSSIDKGNTKSKSGQVGAFINQIKAKTGKSITSEQAELLIQLVQKL